MACSNDKDIRDLIHLCIDGEANEQEVHELEAHLASCTSCQNTYESLLRIEQSLNQLELPEAPIHFTDQVMNRLPKNNKRTWASWLRQHPMVVSTACFIILMLGYVFSIGQDHSFQAKVVKGNGQLAYSGSHTVIVPKNETIKGDVVVKNGDVRIDGKVDGNVILVNSHSLLASAGEVTGHVETVNRAAGWVWYQIKSFFQTMF